MAEFIIGAVRTTRTRVSGFAGRTVALLMVARCGGYEMKVVRVEQAGRADVYNMEVDTTHNFALDNGAIAHNCYDETRYMCMGRPLQAKKPVTGTRRVFDPLGD